MTSYMSFPLYETLQTQDRWLLVFLYSYQIYADFFGYSAIAIGLGLLFGYRLPINFNLPYISTSFSEFWTRWHISLSTWLRTYLYVPLGGNRHGLWRTYLNLMIVMGLGGLWHGAGLSYLMWGLMHGLLLVLERPLLSRLASIDFAVFRTARMTFVFVCVCMLWIFFKLPNFDHALGYLTGMFSPSPNPNPTKLFYSLALLYSLPVMIQHLGFRRCLRESSLGGALSLRIDGRADVSGGRPRNVVHLFSVLGMKNNVCGSVVDKMRCCRGDRADRLRLRDRALRQRAADAGDDDAGRHADHPEPLFARARA